MKTAIYKTIGEPIRTMPTELVHYAIANNVLHPSPYNRYNSGSYYNTRDKNWDFTPEGTIRISDHWNFNSRGRTHCTTDTAVPADVWVVGKYVNGTYQILMQMKKKAFRKSYEKEVPQEELKIRLFRKKQKMVNQHNDAVRNGRQALIASLLSEVVISKMRLGYSVKEKMKIIVKHLPASGYKMGDLFTLKVVVKGETITVTHDTREYYSGRGAKYNAGIRHGDVQEVITVAELERRFSSSAEFLKKEKICKSKGYIKALSKYDREHTILGAPANPWTTSSASDDDYDYDYDYDSYN